MSPSDPTPEDDALKLAEHNEQLAIHSRKAVEAKTELAQARQMIAHLQASHAAELDRVTLAAADLIFEVGRRAAIDQGLIPALPSTPPEPISEAT